MARKPMTDQLIHCNACGVDYSSTYRRCPFCGERINARPADVEEDFDDGYVFDGQALFDDPDPNDDPAGEGPKGGKRLASSGGHSSGGRAPSSGRGRYDATPTVNWARLVTYGISLIIIIAALIIVFTVIYPMVHSDPNAEDPAQPPASSDVQPGGSETDPVEDPNGGVSTDPVEDPTEDPAPSGNGLNSIKLSTYDFTLVHEESHTIKVELDPVGWDGELTWSSSNEEYATVNANGKVTNVNPTTSLRRVTITVTGGGVSQTCTVYCRGTDTPSDAPPVTTEDPSTSEPPATSGELAPGTVGKIVGASGGLRVRSGPGTTYSVKASLVNGNEVTVLEDAGNGWYRISYGGGETGYIMGDFISVK